MDHKLRDTREYDYFEIVVFYTTDSEKLLLHCNKSETRWESKSEGTFNVSTKNKFVPFACIFIA